MITDSHRDLDLVIDARHAGARRAVEAIASALADATPSELAALRNIIGDMQGDAAAVRWLGRLLGVTERLATRPAQLNAVAAATLAPRSR